MIDVFKIGVTIGMTNNVSQVIRIIQRDLFGLKKTVDMTSGGFNKMKLAAAGAMGVIAGNAGLGVMEKLVKAGSAVNEQLAKMKAAGVSTGAVAANSAAALSAATSIRGTTWAGNLSTLMMLRSVLNNSEEARAALPAVARAQFAASVLGIGQEDFNALVKGMDIRGSFIKNGALDPAALAKSMNEAIATVAISGGLLTGRQLFQFTRMAGPAASTIGTENFLRDFVEIMQTVGRTGGRGALYMWKTLLGGGVTKAEAMALQRYGLVKGAIPETAGHYALRPGQMVGYNDLAKNGIINWTYNDLLPALAHKGITTPAQIAAAISSFPVTMQRLVTFLVTNRAQVEKGRIQADKAMGVDQYGSLQANSPAAGMRDFTQAWTELLQALGKPLVRPAYQALGFITNKLIALDDWAGKHQTFVKWAALAAAALSALAIGLGSVAVIVAAGSALALAFSPVGWFVGGVTALGAAVAFVPWKTVFADMVWGFTQLGNAFQAFGKWLNNLLQLVIGWAAKLGISFVHDAQGMLNADRAGGIDPFTGMMLPTNAPTVAGTGHGGTAQHVIVANPGDVGRAVRENFINRAPHMPSAPTPAAMPFIPSLVPAMP